MERLLFLTLFLCTISPCYGIQFVFRTPSLKLLEPQDVSLGSLNASTSQALSIPRGGGGEMAEHICVNGYIALAMANGVGILMSLISTRNNAKQDDRLSNTALGALGSIVTGFGITLLLEKISYLNSPMQSVACGYIPLLVYMATKLNNGAFEQSGIREFPVVLLLFLMGISTADILLELPSSFTLANILVTVLGSVSAIFYVVPARAGKLILGVDASDGSKSKALLHAEHHYLMLAVLFNLCLLQGKGYARALQEMALNHAITLTETILFRRQLFVQLGMSTVWVVLHILFAVWSSYSLHTSK